MAVDARVLSGQAERVGIAQYIAQVLHAGTMEHPSVEMTALSYESDQAGREGCPVHVIPNRRGVPWQSVLLPWDMLRHPRRFDVFHGPAFGIPPVAGVPRIVTIHDLAFARFPDTVRADTVLYLTKMVRRAAAQAQLVIVPSHEVKRDLRRSHPDLHSSRIRVVALGADRLNGMAAPAGRLVSAPYLLHVGTVEPRKNLEFLLEAFALAVEIADLPHRLVLAGSNGWNNQEFWDHFETFRYKDRVDILGYVKDADSARLYRDADLYVAPSHYEGFGLGAFEALWAGCPVVAAPTGGVLDVEAQAGLAIVPSDDPLRWARALTEMLRDRPQVVRDLLPTWAQCREAHRNIYREVAGG